MKRLILIPMGLFVGALALMVMQAPAQQPKAEQPGALIAEDGQPLKVGAIEAASTRGYQRPGGLTNALQYNSGSGLFGGSTAVTVSGTSPTATVSISSIKYPIADASGATVSGGVMVSNGSGTLSIKAPIHVSTVASGTAAPVTTVSGMLNFGTDDPTIVTSSTSKGIYAITGDVTLYATATPISTYSVILYVVDTVSSTTLATVVVPNNFATTTTGLITRVPLPKTFFTTATNSALQLWGTTTATGITATAADIQAELRH